MNKTVKILIVAILIATVGIVIAVKQKNNNPKTEPSDLTSLPKNIEPNDNPQNTENKVSLSIPKLIDLGADKCIPCKMMAPILEELKTRYNGKLQVDFIDVWKNPDEAKKYNIKVIPTQIFYDSSGKELFRHEGFFAKENIIAKWNELGVDLSGPK